jgi:hypothetical protein
MSFTLAIRDETATGKIFDEKSLVFPSEQITIRELIRERVYQEVYDFNQREAEGTFKGLVQPSGTEKILNGLRTEYRMKQRRNIEWKEQYQLAIDMFERNGFFILIDNKQAESLDQEFTIAPDTEVSFVKLTALVGG